MSAADEREFVIPMSAARIRANLARKFAPAALAAGYDDGWRACESRLASPDMADAIANAIDLPQSVVERRQGESDRQLQVRAIQQVIAYGLAKR